MRGLKARTLVTRLKAELKPPLLVACVNVYAKNCPIEAGISKSVQWGFGGE